MEGDVATAALTLAHSILHSSRISFAYAALLDGSSTSLKGFVQWFSWRARSDRANAATLAHYLSARGVLWTPPPAPYDALPVRVLSRLRPPPALAAKELLSMMRNLLYLDGQVAVARTPPSRTQA